MRVLHIACSLGESSVATRLIRAQANVDDIKIYLGRYNSNLENSVLVASFYEEEYAETVFRILKRDIKINFNNLTIREKFKPTSIYNASLEVYKSLGSQ